jgi:hypothetical protein
MIEARVLTVNGLPVTYRLASIKAILSMSLGSLTVFHLVDEDFYILSILFLLEGDLPPLGEEQQ